MKRIILLQIVVAALAGVLMSCVDPVELYGTASGLALRFYASNPGACPPARYESEEFDVPGFGKMVVLRCPGRYLDPAGINNQGQVVLTSKMEIVIFAVCEEAVLFDGEFHVLEKPHSAISIGYGISDTGTVIGEILRASESAATAVVWENGLPIPLPSGEESVLPVAINDQDTIVGRIWQEQGIRLARWQRVGGTHQFADLGGLGDRNDPYAINNRGQILGALYLWEDGVFSPLPIAAVDINDAGWMAGSIKPPDSHPDIQLDSSARHAAIWRDGEIIDLGTLGGGTRASANAINERGQVVGWSQLPDDPAVPPGEHTPDHAFLWENGVMRDLNELAPPGSVSTISRGLDINEGGAILCFATEGEAVIFIPAE